MLEKNLSKTAEKSNFDEIMAETTPVLIAICESKYQVVCDCEKLKFLPEKFWRENSTRQI